MAKIALVFGVLLIVVGLLGYFGTATPNSQQKSDPAGQADDKQTAEEPAKSSPTALIPAFVGGLLALFGVVALNDKFRMHAMHGAALVGVLGFLAGAGRGTMSLVKLMGDNSGEVNQRALIYVWIMAVLCGAFVFMCGQSFRSARLQRESQAESEGDAPTNE